MSQLVAVALITGGFGIGGALIGTLVTHWLTSRTELQRMRLQFEGNLKAKLMDYEREDRLTSVRPLREYISGLGESFGEVTTEAAASGLDAVANVWYTKVSAQLLRGTILRHSIDDDEVCAAMDRLLAKVREFASIMRDLLKASPASEEQEAGRPRLRSISKELEPLARDVHAKLDRYARRVEIPKLED